MEIDQVTRLRKFSAISLGAVLVMAFVLVQPIQTAYAQVSEEGIPAFNDCHLKESGFSLVQMETVRSGQIAKTVHSEKEIYECKTAQGGILLIMEQTIVAEIYENMTTQKIIRTQSEVITCVTEYDNGRILGCDAETPDEESIPLTNCDEDRNPDFGMRTNTVNKGKIVKSIEMNKQILLCDLDNNNNTGECVRFDFENDQCSGDTERRGLEKKLDRVIFTETWENLNLLPDDPVIKKEALGFICVVVLAEDGNGDGDVSDANDLNRDPEDFPARVESCRFQSLGTLT